MHLVVKVRYVVHPAAWHIRHVSHRGRQDSTVLAYVMKTLNERYNYGVNLYLLSIDEGITGYRDDSLEVRLTRSSPLS